MGRSLWESEEQHAGVVAAEDAAREVWGAGPRDQGEGAPVHAQQPGARAADRDESNPEAMQWNAAHNSGDVSRERAVRGGPVRVGERHAAPARRPVAGRRRRQVTGAALCGGVGHGDEGGRAPRAEGHHVVPGVEQQGQLAAGVEHHGDVLRRRARQ